MPDLSLVMNFHREGILAHWSLLAFSRMRECATRAGLTVQLVAVLDRSDEATRHMVAKHPEVVKGDQVLVVDNGDLGLSRNAGVRSADADFIGMLDGDDFCSANWLAQALRTARTLGDSAVVHPDYVVSHGSIHLLGRCVDQLSDDFPTEACFKHHPWVSVVVAERGVFDEIQYRPTRTSETGFGYEDWDWNLEVLASGRKHTVAPETCLFYRRRGDSMLASMHSRQALVRPGRFFECEGWM